MIISFVKIQKLISLFQANKQATHVEGQETFESLDQYDINAYDSHETTIALRKYVEELDEDEIIDLIAIMFFGRGDFSNDFETCRMQAESIYVKDESPPYLLSKKYLDQYLNVGVKKLGLIS